MKISHIRGMLNFHKRAYQAYKKIHSVKAVDARRHMIEMYLELRKTRKAETK